MSKKTTKPKYVPLVKVSENSSSLYLDIAGVQMPGLYMGWGETQQLARKLRDALRGLKKKNLKRYLKREAKGNRPLLRAIKLSGGQKP